MKEKKSKEKYVTPAIEVIEVENEGIMALSDFGGDGGNVFPSSAGTRSSGSIRKANNVHQSAGVMAELQVDLTALFTVQK